MKSKAERELETASPTLYNVWKSVEDTFESGKTAALSQESIETALSLLDKMTSEPIQPETQRFFESARFIYRLLNHHYQMKKEGQHATLRHRELLELAKYTFDYLLLGENAPGVTKLAIKYGLSSLKTDPGFRSFLIANPIPHSIPAETVSK